MVMSVLTLNLLIVGLVLYALVLGVFLGMELAKRRVRSQARAKRRAQYARRRTRVAAARMASPHQPWNKRPDGATVGLWGHGHDERP